MTDQDLNEQDVLAWLQSHPDFLQKNPDACNVLLPPKTAAGKGVADFQSYMIERLKKDKSRAYEATKDIIETSRTNMSNQARINLCVLTLLEATSFENFLHRIVTDLPSILGLDIAAMVVETDGNTIPHIAVPGIKLLPEGTLNAWMGDKTFLLESDIIGIEEIYGGGAGLVASQALMRININPNTMPAILAFGSRDPKTFDARQGTELIQFLAAVTERCFRRWLDLPVSA